MIIIIITVITIPITKNIIVIISIIITTTIYSSSDLLGHSSHPYHQLFSSSQRKTAMENMYPLNIKKSTHSPHNYLSLPYLLLCTSWTFESSHHISSEGWRKINCTCRSQTPDAGKAPPCDLHYRSIRKQRHQGCTSLSCCLWWWQHSNLHLAGMKHMECVIELVKKRKIIKIKITILSNLKLMITTIIIQKKRWW